MKRNKSRWVQSLRRIATLRELPGHTAKRGNASRVWKIPWRKLSWESGETKVTTVHGTEYWSEEGCQRENSRHLKRSCSVFNWVLISICEWENYYPGLWQEPPEIRKIVPSAHNRAKISVCSQQPGWKNSWIMTHWTKQRSANSVKDQEVNIWGFFGPYDLCCNYSTLLW